MKVKSIAIALIALAACTVTVQAATITTYELYGDAPTSASLPPRVYDFSYLSGFMSVDQDGAIVSANLLAIVSVGENYSFGGFIERSTSGGSTFTTGYSTGDAFFFANPDANLRISFSTVELVIGTYFGAMFSLPTCTTTRYIDPYKPSETFCGGSTDYAYGTITAISQTEVTPIPAALPLFATGLGALGLLGWLQRRRALATT